MPSHRLSTNARRLGSLSTGALLLASCSSLLGIEDPVPRDCTGGACEGGSGGVPATSGGKSAVAAGSENEPTDGGVGGEPTTAKVDGGEGGASDSTEIAGVGGETGGAPPLMECDGDERRCDIYQPQKCVSGLWMDEGNECPLACVDGACQVPASCAPPLGPSACVGGVSCCETIWVEGGDYVMGEGDEADEVSVPRRVSGFYLDRFEVSVGRFRTFQSNFRLPDEGDAAHPRIEGTGWQQAWETLPHPFADGRTAVPADKDALVIQLTDDCDASTWTDGNPELPINCINWYVAFAFCAYDGGRLPTEAEWNYAATFGDAQRPYPWSDSPTDLGIDSTRASFYNYPSPPDELPSAVGSFAAGRGGFNRQAGRGHDDLAGNVYEWTLDQWLDDPPVECGADCFAHWLAGVDDRVSRGGAFASDYSYLRAGSRLPATALAIDSLYGIRCARDLSTKDN